MATFGVMFVIFWIIFGIAFVTIIFGFIRTARMSGKVFQMVEQQIDRELDSASRESETAAAPLRSECEHCGSSVAGNVDKCPNCGASMAVD